MAELTATYRLVYFQPDPEDGERVCVALLFNTRRDVELVYDAEFPKLRCLAPHVDREVARVLLDDLAAGVARNVPEIDIFVRRYAPQLVTSETRRSAWPLSDSSRAYLMRRFLRTDRRPLLTREGAAEAKAEKIDEVKAQIRSFYRKIAGDRAGEVQEDANAQWILGRNLPHIAPVTLGLRKRTEIILIDGVDLTVQTPKGALSRVVKVTHTFWQYGRMRQITINQLPLRRIGVVLNGRITAGTAYRDAHDFALHQFSNEADLAIDAGSPEDLKKFENALQP